MFSIVIAFLVSCTVIWLSGSSKEDFIDNLAGFMFIFGIPLFIFIYLMLDDSTLIKHQPMSLDAQYEQAVLQNEK